MWFKLHVLKQRPQTSSYIEGENQIKLYILLPFYIKE